MMDSARNVSMATMEQAAKFIDKCLERDNGAPSISHLCGPMVSGLSEYDYPNLPGIPAHLTMLTQLRTVAKVPLPPEILEHFNHIQCHCMMGLFPEIHRAWLTIDSDIYVWTFEEGADVAYYDGLNDTIVSVGLVQPKRGVFQNFIKYLLILSTAVDIVVLGVTFTTSDTGPLDEIQLVPDPVFTVPTDGATVTVVRGTENGRIFFGCKDGCLYEIVYQAESSWFGKRFKKINHSTSSLSFLVPSFINAALADEDGIAQIVVDDTRNILYSLTEKGAIEVYDLGAKGIDLKRVFKLSQSAVLQQALSFIKTLDSQVFKPIVSISTITTADSDYIHLVAITQAGVRLFFSTVSCKKNEIPLTPRPYTLQMLHVRLPPGFAATNLINRPRAVHMGNYRDRTAVMLSTVGETDFVWCISADLFPFSNCFMEAYTTIQLEGPALAMAEIQHKDVQCPQPTVLNPPVVVRQHMDSARKFVVLTSQGAHILQKLRPVDLLRQLLKESRGIDSDSISAFYTLQQADEACAASLIIASSGDSGGVSEGSRKCYLPPDQESSVADYATRSFFLFGGEPKNVIGQQFNPMVPSSMPQTTPTSPTFNQSVYSGQAMFNPNVISTPMPGHHQVHQCAPNQTFGPNVTVNPNITLDQTFQSNQLVQQNPNYSTSMSYNNPLQKTYNATTIDSINVQYSSKHNGLYIYFARILRPLWKLCCVDKMTADGQKFYTISSLTADECSKILHHLNALRSFLLDNTQLSLCGSSSQQNFMQLSKANASVNQDIQMEEHKSLTALKNLVIHCSQVLALWKILCEHQFHILIESLPDVFQQPLKSYAFKDLFLNGNDICQALINVLINQYLGDNASVDSISSKLRDVCPGLYRTEDAVYSKASETLKNAETMQNTADKEEAIQSALKLCIDVAPNLNLREICNKFTSLGAFKAVVDLCTTCAKRIDPDNIAEHYYNSADQSDKDGFQFYARRMEIYKEIWTMLASLQEKDSLNNVTTLSGHSDVQTVAPSLTTQFIAHILNYSDELLHINVYEWMMRRQMHSEIIRISEPSLEKFLVKASQRDNVHVLDLLWKFYETNGNHANAAQILHKMASITGPSLSLKQRKEYLARAVMCMRSDKVGFAPYLGAFSRELEDKMEIAKVQELVHDSVINVRISKPLADEAIEKLNSDLYDITQLYEEFADPFQLWECKLAIIDCANYADEALILRIWQKIIETEVGKTSGSGNECVIQIMGKLKILVGTYKNSESCFPLAGIIKELERVSATLRADPSLFPNFFVSLDIPMEHIINAYTLVISTSTERFWAMEENEFHFCKCMIALITAFVSNIDKYRGAQMGKLVALCQDTVAGLLSELYSKPNTDHLVGLLRNIQIQLHRI